MKYIRIRGRFREGGPGDMARVPEGGGARKFFARELFKILNIFRLHVILAPMTDPDFYAQVF
jgi:hypothetical protein